MWVSLPPDPLETSVLRRRSLSRRRVKALVRIGQAWTDDGGWTWRVHQIHYKDGIAHLHARIEGRDAHLLVTFTKLGRDYRPEES